MAHKIVNLENELHKDKEESMNKQHKIEQLEDDKVQYQRKKITHDEKIKKADQDLAEKDRKIKDLEGQSLKNLDLYNEANNAFQKKDE